MTAKPQRRIPSYRLHKPTSQAVVTLNGKDVYLGNHGTPMSRERYDRLIAQWLANGRKRPVEANSELTVMELSAIGKKLPFHTVPRTSTKSR